MNISDFEQRKVRDREKQERMSRRVEVKKSASVKDVKRGKDSENERFEPCNKVVLVGRVSAPAVERELPSGDKVVEFRVIVDRKGRRGKKREVDTLDIAAWSASARRSSLSLKAEAWVEIHGAVRRRFWQAPHGLASRWQVEAISILSL